ncbi:phage tail protein [Kosakonia sacchari]|uniref:phage tail protein n=1 Tax=Kosakonia sacchari TaxID=1158459 RepID=UPI0015852D88|nr:phage tail protein [Kosakonia sacchari]NUL35062.1 phage tail protein [Kosakonia sacchari]
MDEYVYSPSNNLFYPIVLKEQYERCNTWPNDALHVTNAVYIEFAATRPPAGKMRAAGADGLPIWIDKNQ